MGSTPYASKYGSGLLRHSLVCFMDVLGWSERTRHAFTTGTQEQFLVEARAAVDRANQQVAQQHPVMPWHSPYSLRTFTDNIVIGMPIEPPKLRDGIREITKLAVGYQAAMSAHGFLVRGGVASGLHFMDDSFVFGDALIEAAHLDTSGRPPMVRYSDSLSQFIREQSDYATMTSLWHPCAAVLEDDLGVLFVNYLSLAFDWVEDGEAYTEILAGHTNVITRGIKEYAGESRILEKFQWAAKYHNGSLANLAAYYRDWHDNEGLGLSGETPSSLSHFLAHVFTIQDLVQSGAPANPALHRTANAAGEL